MSEINFGEAPAVRSKLNGQPQDFFMADTELPVDPVQRRKCEEHIAEGNALGGAFQNFVIGQCITPKEGSIDIYARPECAGASDFGRCRMQIVQYNPDGTPIQ